VVTVAPHTLLLQSHHNSKERKWVRRFKTTSAQRVASMIIMVQYSCRQMLSLSQHHRQDLILHVLFTPRRLLNTLETCNSTVEGR
jgi:hypothetical protein